MLVNGAPHRTIWLEADGCGVGYIDQSQLPHELVLRTLGSSADAANAIATMQVRGAPLIGATAAYGMALAMAADPCDDNIGAAYEQLLGARPTAIDLKWALDELEEQLSRTEVEQRRSRAYQIAARICDDSVRTSKAIGGHGLGVIRDAYERAGENRPVNILTHCNAGWLAAVDWGTALAPVYVAQEAGIPLHVWVDETRPRNQGAALTAWELGHQGIAHTVIVDNVGGHLMQHGQVDLCIVGTDRTGRRGDVCNKIGTYLKALAARDNKVPFYVAVPHSSIDWNITEAFEQIPIEERDPDEVHTVRSGNQHVRVTPKGSAAKNFGFDITPARLVTALISERGVCQASETGLLSLYPERV